MIRISLAGRRFPTVAVRALLLAMTTLSAVAFASGSPSASGSLGTESSRRLTGEIHEAFAGTPTSNKGGATAIRSIATCPAKWHLLSGGYMLRGSANISAAITMNAPYPDEAETWVAEARTDTGKEFWITAYALCTNHTH